MTTSRVGLSLAGISVPALYELGEITRSFDISDQTENDLQLGCWQWGNLDLHPSGGSFSWSVYSSPGS